MADPLTVFAIGDIDELGLRGVVLRGTDPEAIREAGRNLHKPVVVVPVEQWKQAVEALSELCERYDSFAGQPFVNPPDSTWGRARAALSSIQKEGSPDA